MHALPPKSLSAAAISLCGGCGHTCSTKPHKLPAHPSPPPGLRRGCWEGFPRHCPSTWGSCRLRLARWSLSRLPRARTRHSPSCVILPADRPSPMLPLRPKLRLSNLLRHARSPPHNFWHRFEAPVGERQQAPPGRPMNISESFLMMRRMVGFSTSSPSFLPKPMSRRWPSLHSELAAWSRCASLGEVCGPLLSEMSLGASLDGS